MLRGRRIETVYHYDDPEHPGRITSAVAGPAYTADDRCLLLGLQAYEDSLCPGCGIEKDLAWHDWTAGSWESDKIVCHPCTAAQGEEMTYQRTSTSLTEAELDQRPPFEWGETTTPATPPSDR